MLELFSSKFITQAVFVTFRMSSSYYMQKIHRADNAVDFFCQTRFVWELFIHIVIRFR